MFDAAAFATMRPGAWFVNVGRGEIVDEPALIAALGDGHIGGAGLDVFATEPLPHDSPLWSMPNVIITPHSSGVTERHAPAGRSTCSSTTSAATCAVSRSATSTVVGSVGLSRSATLATLATHAVGAAPRLGTPAPHGVDACRPTR